MVYLLELPPDQWNAIGEFISIGVAVEDDRFLDKIIDRIGAHREPGPRIKATVQARNVLAILVTHGFPFAGHVEILDEGLDWVAGWSCRELARRLLFDDRIGEADRNAGFLLLGSFSDEEWLALMQASGDHAPLAPLEGHEPRFLSRGGNQCQ